MDFGKITFSRTYDNDETIVHTISGESTLTDVLEAFQFFLKGCGYHFDGYVDIVDDEAWGDEEDEEEEHSEFYYDTERNKPISSYQSDTITVTATDPWPFPTYGAAQPSYTMSDSSYGDVTITFGEDKSKKNDK